LRERSSTSPFFIAINVRKSYILGMFKFIIALLLFGKADVNDNVHVYLGKDPKNKMPAPVVAVEYTKEF